jgi:hypothetical protein
MANAKITALSADTAPTSDDLIVTVNDAGGSPANKKVTLANAITKAHGLTDGVAKVSSGALTVATSLTVPEGGTGAATLLDHGVLVGSGTDAVTPLAVGTNGQVLVGSTGADPVFVTVTDGEGIDTTPGAGTLTIACEDAATDNKGVLALAVASDLNTGTDTAKAVTSDALAGSNIGTKSMAISITESDTSVAIVDGKVAIPVPVELNGMNIVDALAVVHTKGVTNTLDIQVRRRRAGSDVDVLSTKITVGDEYFARDGVVNTDNDDLATGDALYVDIDAVHTTPAKGLAVVISARLP